MVSLQACQGAARLCLCLKGWKDLTDVSSSLCLHQHLHGYSPGMAPEDVWRSHDKRNKVGESWLNASDHLCQCHHCICHCGMKPPRQATQWGVSSGEGVGNKLWLLQWMERQWMTEWLTKKRCQGALCYYSVSFSWGLRDSFSLVE